MMRSDWRLPGTYSPTPVVENGRHGLVAQFRQSVFGRLGGYDDVNDADRLSLDPVMRWIVGGQAVTKQAASSSQMGRFETEVLATEENLTALADLSGQWIDRVHERHPPKMIVLDMDSSVSPTHGDQEGSAYNGHFGCSCYHPLFVFNQFGDLERSSLRPGTSTAPTAGATFWNPSLSVTGNGTCAATSEGMRPSPHRTSEFLEAEAYTYAIRLKERGFQESMPICSPVPLAVRPTMGRYYASFSYQAGSWERKRRIVAKVEWHPGELYPRVGFIVTNLSRPAERVVAFYNQRGKAEQYIKEGKNAIKWIAAVVPQVPRQCRPAPASHPGLQSRQLHADTGFAEGGGTMVSDHTTGKVGEDRCQSGQSWPVRHVPIARGCRPKKLVPKNLEFD